MSKKQKLELTWIGKEHRPRLEPRILMEEPDKSHHAAYRVTERDLFDNLLVRGDNLLGLKALEQKYAGKVKCVVIDPLYNTGSAPFWSRKTDRQESEFALLNGTRR